MATVSNRTRIDFGKDALPEYLTKGRSEFDADLWNAIYCISRMQGRNPFWSDPITPALEALGKPVADLTLRELIETVQACDRETAESVARGAGRFAAACNALLNRSA